MKRAAHVVAFVFPLGFNLVKTSYDGRTLEHGHSAGLLTLQRGERSSW